MHWYVVRTAHGQTDLADQEIREAGFDVVTARMCRPATKARRSASGSLIRATEESTVPLFVRYVIVRFSLADPRWRLIPNMDSVERIISGGYLSNGGIGIPIAVPDSAIDWLRKKLSPAGVCYPPGYKPPGFKGDVIEAGTALQPLVGPLADHDGIAELSDGNRIVLLMSMFNRDNVRVTMAQASVETS